MIRKVKPKMLYRGREAAIFFRCALKGTIPFIKFEDIESVEREVRAAGIDVIHGEWMEDITRHPLVQYAQKHDNLVITPHIGGVTVESIAGARIFMAQKLADYIKNNF